MEFLNIIESGDGYMRENFCADWAFGIKGSIEKLVKDNYPQELHSWPILKNFNFGSYWWKKSYIIFILNDQLSGIPAGPGNPEQLKNDDGLPLERPNKANISIWLDCLTKKFDVKTQDAVMIIPAHDSGQNKVEADWHIWNDEERELWNIQLQWNFMRQIYFKRGVNLMSDFYVPPGYQFLNESCAAFLKEHPDYHKNVFIMTRFVAGNKLLESLDLHLRCVLRKFGLNPLRADDKMYMQDRSLWNNVCTYMICCKYGIAILEDRVVNEFNPNVALEYGFMRALNKSTLLLTDVGFRNLRADILGTLREEFDIADIESSVQPPIERWLRDLNIIGS